LKKFSNENLFFKILDDFLSPKIQFSVPTGNFGDVLAGYYATQMGIPIEVFFLKKKTIHSKKKKMYIHFRDY